MLFQATHSTLPKVEVSIVDIRFKDCSNFHIHDENHNRIASCLAYVPLHKKINLPLLLLLNRCKVSYLSITGASILIVACLKFLSFIRVKLADPFLFTSPFTRLRPTYFRATQYQSLIGSNMPCSKSNLATS